MVCRQRLIAKRACHHDIYRYLSDARSLLTAYDNRAVALRRSSRLKTSPMQLLDRLG